MPLVLAPVAALIAALFALLFMLAWRQWGNVIVNTISVDLPIVGNVLGSLVQEALDGAYTVIVFWLDAALDPVVNFVLAPVAALEAVLGSIKSALDYYAASIGNIATVTIPQVINGAQEIGLDAAGRVLAATESSLIGAIFVLRQEFDQEIQATIAPVTAEVANIPTLIAQAVAALPATTLDITQLTSMAATAAADALSADLGVIQQYVQTAYGDSITYANSLITGVENDIGNALTRAEQFASSAVAGAGNAIITDLDTAISGVLGTISTDLDTAIADVTSVIGTDDADILSAIRAIPLGKIGDIAGVAALSGATALALTRYLKDCGIPNCRNLSQYGKELQELLGLIGGADLLNFLVGLIKNPGEASDTVESTFGSLIDDTLGTFKTLIAA